MSQLFSQFPWHSIAQRLETDAINDVNALNRRAFDDPALAGTLDKIVEKHGFEVAALDRAGTKGKRYERSRQITDYGQHRTVMQKVMDVSIPFVGEPQSFYISPSNSTVIQDEAALNGRILVLTLPDDDNVQRNVDRFCEQITTNLENLRRDVNKWAPQLKASVEAAVQKMRDTIAAERERDNKLNFKVDDA